MTGFTRYCKTVALVFVYIHSFYTRFIAKIYNFKNKDASTIGTQLLALRRSNRSNWKVSRHWPNLMEIGPSATEIWRHIDFSRWRPRRHKSASGSYFWHVDGGSLDMAKIYRHTKFHRNRTIRDGDMTSFQFSRWRPPPTLEVTWGNGGPPTKCNSWSEHTCKIACWSDYHFRRYCDWWFLAFWLEIAYLHPFWGSLGRSSTKWRHSFNP